jgi:hypothetical protein
MANKTISARICIATGKPCTDIWCGVHYACGILLDPRGQQRAQEQTRTWAQKLTVKDRVAIIMAALRRKAGSST